jgi:hypothetical protein
VDNDSAEITELAARITHVLQDIEAIERDLARVPDMPASALRVARDRMLIAAGSVSLASAGMRTWPSIQGTWRRHAAGGH